LELLRDQWKQRSSPSPNSNQQQYYLSGWEQAGQALVNGSIAGMIAAAFTTPRKKRVTDMMTMTINTV
jgi:hypothetical protein